MKKNRLIFYAVFGGFHLFLVIFTFYIEAQRNDFAFLTRMLSWISVLKWGALLGLVLLITDVIWDFTIFRDSDKQKAALNHEIQTLKAKLFDIQEASKGASQQQINPNPKP